VVAVGQGGWKMPGPHVAVGSMMVVVGPGPGLVGRVTGGLVVVGGSVVGAGAWVVTGGGGGGVVVASFPIGLHFGNVSLGLLPR
jgi:hypothetical protein